MSSDCWYILKTSFNPHGSSVFNSLYCRSTLTYNVEYTMFWFDWLLFIRSYAVYKIIVKLSAVMLLYAMHLTVKCI